VLSLTKHKACPHPSIHTNNYPTSSSPPSSPLPPPHSDQTFPKRCGQLKGKTIDSLEIYLERIKAAIEAKTDSNLVVIARTDARQAPGGGFDEGVTRLKGKGNKQW